MMPVTVAAYEQSFSALKTYLRSIMCQERVTGLAMISINYSDIIDTFSSKKVSSFLKIWDDQLTEI